VLRHPAVLRSLLITALGFPALGRRLRLTARHQGNDCQGGENADQRDHIEGIAHTFYMVTLIGVLSALAVIALVPGRQAQPSAQSRIGTPRILARVAPRNTAETAEARLSTGASSAA
jgi:hypothetical protein